MSPNVAVRTPDPAEAVAFYTKVLGYPMRSDNAGVADLDADPWNLFVIEDKRIRGPILELFVDDLEVAKETLVAEGCKVLRWRGKGHDCYVEDPFGVVFNIWEAPPASG
ncbi:MAG: VOC family protein [Thermoplasmata archaeon]